MGRDGHSITVETTVSSDSEVNQTVTGEDDETSAVVYQRTCEEARKTIDQQLAWNREIDDKAARLLRINVALAALVITGLSLGMQYLSINGTTEAPKQVLGATMNPYFTLGSILFVTSTAIAGITYTKSSLKVGLDSGSIDKIIDDEHSTEGFYRQLAAGYRNWAKHNSRIVTRNGRYTSLSVLSLVYSVVFVLIGITRELNFGMFWTLFGIGLLFFVTITFHQKPSRHFKTQ